MTTGVRGLAITAAVMSTITALLVGVPRLASINRDDPKPQPTLPPTHVIHLSVDGDATGRRAEYQDAHGTQLDPAIDGDIQVTGLVWVTLAVYGQDIGCSITLDGVTVAAEGSNVGDGDGVIDICTYAPGGARS